MSIIDTFNSAIPAVINKENEIYETVIGKIDFTSEIVITESNDFNCGATCNELEFAREVVQYYTKSLYIDNAENENLDLLITNFIDLPRRNEAEEDEIYRNRYKFSVVAKTNPRRLTKWAIKDAILHFIADPDSIQIIEIFDTDALYFQVRIEGASIDEDAIFIDSVEQGFIDQNFIGGSGVGAVISYLGEMIDRVKPQGVSYDIMFIAQNRFNTVGNAIIGSIQMYITGEARIKASYSIDTIGNAIIV